MILVICMVEPSVSSRETMAVSKWRMEARQRTQPQIVDNRDSSTV